MPEIEYDIDEGIGLLRLNRPERKNSMTLEMIDRVVEVLRRAKTDDGVRVVLVAGAGDAFCSGVDLSFLEPAETGLSASPLTLKRLLTDHIHNIAYAVEDLDKPIIAAVNGPAVGAGMDLALMCDLRVAGSAARFAEAYIRAGLVPGAGACYFLPRLVGPAKALELLLTGEFIDAEEAARIGVVNRVVPDDELEDAARDLARRIASGPPIAAAMIRRATYQSMRSDLRTSLDLISSHMGVVTSTIDTAEALRAIRERRKPNFTGT